MERSLFGVEISRLRYALLEMTFGVFLRFLGFAFAMLEMTFGVFGVWCSFCYSYMLF